MTFICGLIHIHHSVLGKKFNRNFVFIRTNLTQNFAENTFSLRIQTVAAVKGKAHENMHLVYKKKGGFDLHENTINLTN
jgi:hypothetical protein